LTAHQLDFLIQHVILLFPIEEKKQNSGQIIHEITQKMPIKSAKCRP